MALKPIHGCYQETHQDSRTRAGQTIDQFEGLSRSTRDIKNPESRSTITPLSVVLHGSFLSFSSMLDSTILLGFLAY